MFDEIDETTSDIDVIDPMVGTEIEGKYRVDRLLGQGGMGKVFKVTHLKLGKTFALKLMHQAQATANPANLVRFEREAEALARVTHPNVVMVTDFGVLSAQDPYIVMEYIEGDSLRKLLKKDGQLSERQTINITKQICAGLHEAHRQGIVHRDLKPENIMIQRFDDGDSMARVLDFGIAVMKESANATLTEDWGMGTLKYMSPEQMYGVPLDARSDIFTICLMMYEMLTGTVPIVMMGKVTQLIELRPSVTPMLAEIIHRGISLDVGGRQRSVLELKRELETVEQETMFQGAELAPTRNLVERPTAKKPRPTAELSNAHTSQQSQYLQTPNTNSDQKIPKASPISATPSLSGPMVIPSPKISKSELKVAPNAPSTKPMEVVQVTPQITSQSAKNISPNEMIEEFSLDLNTGGSQESQDIQLADEEHNITSVVDARLMEAVKSLALTSDFEMFLAGIRAPLIVAPSLVKELSQGPEHVANLVIRWVLQIKEIPFQELLLNARNKIFDIFFYQIVNFKTIYSFFPAFEQSLISLCPVNEQEKIAQMFQQFRWQDIRPIGLIRKEKQEKFIAEKRKEVVVQVDKFNEGVYKNLTYNVLSSEKRYNFKDEKTAEKVTECQTKVKTILSDFIDLIKDKRIKKEILLANESDKYNEYENKEAFKPENYIVQLADLGVALFNDNFPYQSVQVFQIILELSNDWQVDFYNSNLFQEKGQLLNTQNIEAYVASEQDRFLIREIISVFVCWHPQYLLNHLQIADDRRIRRTILRMLECYGQDIYRMLIDELATNARTQPWYYARNITSLLSKINCRDEAMKNEAVALLDSYWQKTTQRQLIYQIITTLSFIGTDFACERLIARYRQIENDKSKQAIDLCQKLILAFMDMELDKGLEIVVDFYQKTGELKQVIERFNNIYIGNYLVQSIATRIWKEIQRLKFSFSLLGDAETTVELLRLVAHMKTEPVIKLCREITEKLARKHPLVAEAEKILNGQQAVIFYSSDRMLQRFAISKNIPKMVCYIADMGITTRLLVTTRDAIAGQIDFYQGNVWKASVTSYQLTGENAFYWCFLLEVADVESIYFQPAQRPTMTDKELVTTKLITNGLLQRGEITQIGSNYLQLESRFRQRPVNIVYTSFEQLTDEPNKYRAVWNALAEDISILELRKVTRLSKHELYKILLYFFKHKMLIIDGHKDAHKELYVEDGFVMLELNLKRIERRSVMFNYYKTAGEICADLMRETQDQVLLYVLDVMRRFYLERYENRRVLMPNELKVCLHAVTLSINYIKHPVAEEQNLLVNYMQNNFEIREVTSTYEEAFADDPALRTGAVEKLENIEANNDPLDVEPAKAQDLAVGANIEAINNLVDQVVEQEAADDEPEIEIKDKFDAVAMACVKPLKDFIRELYRNWKAGRETSVSWIDLVEPALMLLASSAEKLGDQTLRATLLSLHTTLRKQKARSQSSGENVFDAEMSQELAVTYLRLCELQPKTFALVAGETDLAERKDLLLVKFILRQVPEIDDNLVNKFIFTGWNKFDRFTQATPEEISKAIGITKNIAEQVCLKFYQYRNIYYKDGVDYENRFLAMFELNLQLLQEMHTDVEQAIVDEEKGVAGAKEQKDYLKPERQRMLWSLFILLAIREEYDLIQMIQQSVFDMRISLLEDYLAKLISVQKSIPALVTN